MQWAVAGGGRPLRTLEMDTAPADETPETGFWGHYGASLLDPVARQSPPGYLISVPRERGCLRPLHPSVPDGESQG